MDSLKQRLLGFKNGHKRRQPKENDKENNKLTVDSFLALFRSDATRQAERGKGGARESVLIEQIKEKLVDTSMADTADITDETIRYALRIGGGNVSEAVDVLELLMKSYGGEVVPYYADTNFQGAENRSNVTCYLDALLFAMFAKIDYFAHRLRNLPPEEEDPRRKLCILILLWANLLRSNKLIPAHLTQLLQDALAECGWPEARKLEQQDASEAFLRICDNLELPLLTLKVDFFHQGEAEEADSKVHLERILDLPVPVDPEGKGVTLENCINEYLSSVVFLDRERFGDVKEGIWSTANSAPGTPARPNSSGNPMLPKSTIRLVTQEDDDDSFGHPLSAPPTNGHDATGTVSGENSRRWTDFTGLQRSGSLSSLSCRQLRRGSQKESLIHKTNLNNEVRPSPGVGAGYGAGTAHEPEGQTSESPQPVLSTKEIPAWQFFRLIPWLTSSNQQPQSNSDLANHFSQRPVVAICLKRYTMEGGVPKRHNTFVDIPRQLKFPHCMIEDEERAENSGCFCDEFKLVLQSVVCHRGETVQAGHYVAFSRVAPKRVRSNSEPSDDAPPDYTVEQWKKFDDLDLRSRVKDVENIEQALKEEMPYLLFYQITPMLDDFESSEDADTADRPPSYEEAAASVVLDTPDLRKHQISASIRGSSYFDINAPPSSASASFRISDDNTADQPDRPSFTTDEDGYLCVSRPSSAAWDSAPSPEITFVEGPSNTARSSEETTVRKLTRAAAKLRPGAKSRSHSQGPEGRIGLTMSWLGLGRGNKDMPRDRHSSEGGSEDVEPNSSASENMGSNDGATEEKKDKDKDKGKDKGKKKEKQDKSKIRDKGKAKEKEKEKGKDKEKEKGKDKAKKGEVCTGHSTPFPFGLLKIERMRGNPKE